MLLYWIFYNSLASGLLMIDKLHRKMFEYVIIYAFNPGLFS